MDNNQATFFDGHMPIVLPEIRHGVIKVELLEYMGSDLRIVNSARVSYAVESQWKFTYACHWCLDIADEMHQKTPCKKSLPALGNKHTWVTHENILSFPDAKLINFLMKNEHGTPFESVVFTFRVGCPIFIAREWFRHRIASYNEISTRYVEMEPEFYIPPPGDIRKQVGKPGHYTYEQMTAEEAERVIAIQEEVCTFAYMKYQEMLAMGAAREVARNILPMALMTQFYWTVNLRSLFNFMHLRSDSRAAREIQYGSNQVVDLVTPLVPIAMKAWEENGRKRP